jgi:hypothetical protein
MSTHETNPIPTTATATPVDTSFPAAPAPLQTAAPRKATLSSAQRKKLRELAAMVGGETRTTVELRPLHNIPHGVMALYAHISYFESLGKGYEAARSHTALVIYHKVPDVHDDAFYGAQEAFGAKVSLANAYFEERKRELQAEKQEQASDAGVPPPTFIPYGKDAMEQHAAGEPMPEEYLYTYWLVNQQKFPEGSEWQTTELVPTIEDGIKWGCKRGEEVKVWRVPASARGNEIHEMIGSNVCAVYIWKDQYSGGWAKKWFPKTGDGCCYHIGTDRYPYTVIKVSESGKTIWIQEDEFNLVKGSRQSEQQKYEFTPNPNGRIMKVTRRQSGAWVPSGGSGSSNGYVTFGRYAYLDPSF